MSAATAPLPNAARTAPVTPWWRLGRYIRRNRGRYVVGAVASLLYDAAFIAIPLLVGWAISAIADGLGSAVVVERCVWIAVVTVVGGVFRVLSRTFIFNAGREIEYELRNDLFRHLQRLPQSFYLRWRTGDVMSRCVNDLNSVRMMLGPGLLNMVNTPILYVGCFFAMFAIDVNLTLLVLLPYPLFILIARAFGRPMHQAALGAQEGLAELSNQLQETISGIAVVKAYAMEDARARHFDAANDELFRRALRLVRVNTALPPITSLLPALAMGIVLLVGGREIAMGRMAIADFFKFALYIYQLTFPTFLMGWVFALVQRGAASLQRIDEILSTRPSIADTPQTRMTPTLRGDIEFRNLTFSHPGSGREPALRDISLSVPAGTTLGIVGPVGSGKTTLASLIPRLYEVEDGRVFIDGIDVNEIPLATLRKGIAMVPQDSFLFSMSLADNIAYGLPETDLAVVREATERAQLTGDLAELPHGLDTLVGERGVMLSGGQRQRAALARALALRPRILVLDDALSSVDAATESAIQRNLEEVFAGRTVVVIAHRVSTVRHADQIVVLDAGRIVERGTHAELVAAGGIYARTALEQALEQALEEELIDAGDAA
ncbi:MAG: ABC transporter ATP-binding protein [Deltaproteobacteria bacterium]|nr:MAG: ABC transporter ATP-binding protein [Deltaproteobacteria bacterium]